MDAKFEFKYISYTELDIEENYRRVPVILTDDKRLLSGRTNNGSTYKAISGIQFQKTGISKDDIFNAACSRINRDDTRKMKSKLNQRNVALDIISDIHSLPQCATVPRMFKLDLSKLTDTQCLDKTKESEPDPVKTLNLSPRFPSKKFLNRMKKVEMDRKRPVPSPFRYRAALPSDRGNKVKRTSSLSPNFHRKVFQDAGAVKPLQTPISLPALRDITTNSPLRNIMTNAFRMNRMFPNVKQLKFKSHIDDSRTKTGIKAITVEDALSALDDQSFSLIKDIPNGNAKSSEQLPIKPVRKKLAQFTFEKNGCRTEFNDSNRDACGISPRMAKKGCITGEENIQPQMSFSFVEKKNSSKAKSDHCSRTRPVQFDNRNSHKRLMQTLSLQPTYGESNGLHLSTGKCTNFEENSICTRKKFAQQLGKVPTEKTDMLIDLTYATQCRIHEASGASRNEKLVGTRGESQSSDQCKSQSVFGAVHEVQDHNLNPFEPNNDTNFKRDHMEINNECRSSELVDAIRQRKLSSRNSFKDKITRFFVGRQINSSDEVISTLRDVNRKVAFHRTDALPITTPPPRTVVLFKELKTKENELGTVRPVSKKFQIKLVQKKEMMCPGSPICVFFRMNSKLT
ncbi:uncharacterized protein LOC136041355 isoform X2 [Artemia franciscana]|uniref:uncharacterized protein LOC136041355 isoform X2 n=1 Tax=Artemia franciscana TaxID=6661 RepID=UPI0032DB070A